MKFDEICVSLGLILLVGYILFGCYIFFGHEKVNIFLAVSAVFYGGVAIWLFIKKRFFK